MLSPYIVAQPARVGWFVRGFSSFSVCLLRILRSTTGRQTCFWLLLRRLFLFQRFLWPCFSAAASDPMISLSNEIAVTLAHALHQSGPTFVAAYRAENLTARFPAWLFPCFQRCFSSAVFQRCFLRLFPALPWMLPACLSSAAGTLRLPPFLCLPSPLFLSPQALARPFLARWFEAPIIASYVFSSVSLHSESLV